MKFNIKEIRRIILEEVESERLEGLAINIKSEDSYTSGKDAEINIQLYRIRGINSIEIIGMIDMGVTENKCISKTYQVEGIAVDSKFQSQGYGLDLYKIGMFYVNSLGAGLTSDHMMGTLDKASEFWKKLESKGSIAIKRRTGKGTEADPHDTFDYEGDLTPDDPNDDCDEPMVGAASDHSWELIPNEYSKMSQVVKKLLNNHNRYISELDKESQKNSISYLSNQSGKLFGREYSKASAAKDINKINTESDFINSLLNFESMIKEELQVILTNEEAAEMFGNDILEQLDPDGELKRKKDGELEREEKKKEEAEKGRLSFMDWVKTVEVDGFQIGEEDPNPYDAWYTGMEPEYYREQSKK